MTPWAGMADDDDIVASYIELGVLSEEKYRQIIRRDLIPYYGTLPENVKLDLLKRLKSSIEENNCNFERAFYSHLPPFDAPEDPKLFFVWMLEELIAIA